MNRYRSSRQTKKLGTVIKQPADVSKHEAEERISGRREATGGERTSLITTAVGTDLGMRGLEAHPVLCGSSVPSGEDSSKIRINVLTAVKHGTP